MEKLQGCDVLTYFALRQEYNEQMVASVASQVCMIVDRNLAASN